MKRLLCVLSLLLLLPAGAYAQRMQYYMVQSGTGFFVNRNYVITNAHVIRGCKDAIVKGAVPESNAQVQVEDDDNDLALLYTDKSPQQFAPLRFNIDELKPGDKVVLLGYPGEAGVRGESTFVTAQLLDMPNIKGPKGRFYITDVVEHGNSGGPVFDTSGNVIGVVVAKGTVSWPAVYTISPNGEQTQQQQAYVQHYGLAIDLNTLKQFLFDHGVFTEWLGSSIPYEDSTIQESVKNYIVNVQCRMPSNGPADGEPVMQMPGGAGYGR